MEKPLPVDALDENDVALLRYMRRAYDCRQTGANCPAAADCPEGFYICDALVNIVDVGSRPDLGHTAKMVVRFLYEQLDCDAEGCCPAVDRCHEGGQEPCQTLLRKLGVTRR